jgi:uncharacterized lipoprotein NlpE involved in copper resistance
MNFNIVVIACICLFFLSFKKEMQKIEDKTDSIVVKTDSAVVDGHNSQNSLDWQGIYKGILPCADCEGIETTITLNTDDTFSLTTKYLGKGDGKVFEVNGNFTWYNTNGIVFLNGIKERAYLYKVGENTLIQLDMKGYPIKGQLANKYILKKVK